MTSPPEEKACGLPSADDQNPPLADAVSSAAPVMGLPATQTGADNLCVGSCLTFPQNPTPFASADKEKEEEDGVSLLGTEGGTKLRGFSSTPTAQFPLPAQRVTLRFCMAK